MFKKIVKLVLAGTFAVALFQTLTGNTPETTQPVSEPRTPLVSDSEGEWSGWSESELRGAALYRQENTQEPEGSFLGLMWDELSDALYDIGVDQVSAISSHDSHKIEWYAIFGTPVPYPGGWDNMAGGLTLRAQSSTQAGYQENAKAELSRVLSFFNTDDQVRSDLSDFLDFCLKDGGKKYDTWFDGLHVVFQDRSSGFSYTFGVLDEYSELALTGESQN